MVQRELARTRTAPSPSLDEFAVPGELDDARIGIAAVAVADKDVAVRRHRDVGRRVEGIRPVAGDTRPAQRHQHLAVRAELEDLMAAAVAAAVVRHPDIAVAIDVHSVGMIEHPLPKSADEFSRRVEFLDRVQHGTGALGAATAVKHPQAPAVAIDIDADGLAHRAAFRHLQPTGLKLIGIWRAVGVGRPLSDGVACRQRQGEREGGNAGRHGQSASIRHQKSSLRLRLERRRALQGLSQFQHGRASAK